MDTEKKENDGQTVEIVQLKNNLLQSNVLAFASFDYTLPQNKALTQIVKKMQKSIKEAITRGKNVNTRQLSIFTDEEFQDDNENNIRIRIPMKDFGIQPDKYGRMREFLLKMSTIPISVPYYDKNGQLWEEIGGLCKVRIPRKKLIDSVDIIIEKKTARYLLDMKFGYSDFYEEVVMRSKKQHTPRIYLLLCAYVKRAESIQLKVKDLRTQLKLEKKYPIFRDFVKNVLESSRKELVEMYEDGVSDFYFEYEKKYGENQIKKGEPENIIFKFHTRKELQGNEEDTQQQLVMKRHQVYDLLRRRFINMEENMAHHLSQQVTFTNHLKVLCKIQELASLFSSANCNIVNKQAYTYKTLTQLFAGETNDSTKK